MRLGKVRGTAQSFIGCDAAMPLMRNAGSELVIEACRIEPVEP